MHAGFLRRILRVVSAHAGVLHLDGYWTTLVVGYDHLHVTRTYFIRKSLPQLTVNKVKIV